MAFGMDNAAPAVAVDSSVGCSAALAVDGRVVWSGDLAPPGRGGETLVAPRLVRMLQEHGMMVRDVRAWTVGTGPGSFTGLRSGIALVMGVCRGSGAVCRGLPSAWALARQAFEQFREARTVAVLHDARRNEIIVSVYRMAEDGLPAAAGGAAVHSVDETVRLLEQVDAAVSPHGERLKTLLPSETVPPVLFVDGVDCRWFLTPPVPPWPATPDEGAKSLQPVYVRPAVFTRPRM